MHALVGLALSLVMSGVATQDGAPPPAAARARTATAAKLPAAVAKEMADAIVAANKALGLESWPAHGVKPCIDRGGQGVLAKNVSADDARRCAAAAVEKGFPELGKAYDLAILMSEIGPVTVIALGTGEAGGWGAYSCDPTRTCKPMKINPANKWGKRLDERRAKACSDATTVWLPEGQKACPQP
ncbi:MAG TPA: hypothetical protein VHK47_10115 [Polyangia bacterium]|jgi:hypothetical protein|nr:hypothetical protein [Polyangia bacterium]